MPEDLTTVTDDGEVTIAEAQAIIDIQTDIYNAAIIDLLTRPAEVEGGVGASFTDELARVYVGNALDLYFQAWDSTARGDFEGGNIVDPTGVVDTVEEVIEVQPDCFVVRISRDQGGIAQGGVVEDYWIRQAQVDRLATNASGWHRANDTNTAPQSSMCSEEIPA
ncbi:MAG TPA: hypothetical protein VJ978_06700 [Nitriliruptoraceae bacterium]|nr:hypothetical protein [Nitriliruptoraceae bacterium]